MTYQPGEQPYTQPQDPWSGTQGIAAAPTDPIPQPVRGQFTPGVASPRVWSQETVAHSDPYVTSGGGGGGRTGIYVLVVLLVVVLGGAGGFGAWWAITNYGGSLTSPPTTPATDGTTSLSPTPEPTETDYNGGPLAQDTCMINRGTAERADMYVVACDWDGGLEKLQVLRTISGEQIPEDANGNFTADLTAQPLCGDLDRFDRWFGWNSPNDAQDQFFCMSTDIRES